jgi:hypothetical protein
MFTGTYAYMSEVVLSFSKHLTSFFCYKKIRKDSRQNRCPSFENPIDRYETIGNENDQLYLWRMFRSTCGNIFSPIIPS